MILPNAEYAVVDLRKLRDYCLNFDHPVGKHKARVFLDVLGLAQKDAETLRVHLLSAARHHDAVFKGADAYGARYEVNFAVRAITREATICSAWIIRHGEDFPRLVSCRVTRRRR